MAATYKNGYSKVQADERFVGVAGSTMDGNLTLPTLQFNLTSESIVEEGQLAWNETDGTLDLGLDGGEIQMQLGQEMFVKVRANEDIANGQVVYLSGRTGAYPDVRLEKADAPLTCRVVGVCTKDITANDFGYITTFGYVRKIKTNYTGSGIWGTTWAEGDLLYVSKDVAGQLTNIEPTEPHHADIVGTVGVVHSTLGSILVTLERHYTLEELSDVNGTALSTTGQFPVWHEGADYFDFDYNINDYVPRTILSDSEDPTGFIAPEDVIVTGDSASRTITLTGTVKAYYQGTLVPVLSSGWTSPVHTDDPTKRYFLYYDGNSISWNDSATLASDFYKNLLICWTFHNASGWVYQRECHSVMQHTTHREFHEVIGTYRQTGGTLSNYTLNSTTVANRRPTISEALIYDEDLPTINPALASGPYTQFWLSGSTGVGVFGTSDDIVPLNGNQPYYNQFNGTIWTQTPMSNNDFMSVWIVAVPMAADVESQKHRFIFVQGQSQSASLSEEQSLSPLDLRNGLPVLTPESVFIGRIILKYQSSNWTLIEVEDITGTGRSQVASPAGNYLSLVSTDDTINGNGTPASPLTINPNITGTTLTLDDITFTSTITSPASTVFDGEFLLINTTLGERLIPLWQIDT